MHLCTDRRLLSLLTVILLVGIAVAQTSSTPSQPQQSPVPAATPTPEYKPGQQGDVDGGLIMPIEPGQEQSNAPAPAADQGGTASENPSSPNQPGSTVQVPAQPQQGQGPDSQQDGVFVFRKQVEEVTLHATVVDDRQRLITTLDRSAFAVYEDGQPQQITSFRHEDIPVALGIVVDNSGSMRDKREKVGQAAVNLVKASNPDDQVFVVNFNDEAYLDQDFTNSIQKLQEALSQYQTRGGTALYEAVIAANDHLAKAPRLEKKVLFVVTDGEDKTSVTSLEQTIRKVQVENGPTIYTIGILEEGGGGMKKRAQRALRQLSEATGGVAFFPTTLDEVDRITQQVAHDIRSQYTLGYKPSNPKSSGGFRSVKVEARARGFGKLQVRTRSGYYAGREQAESRSSQSVPASTQAKQQ